MKDGWWLVRSTACQRERKRQIKEHQEAMAVVDDPSCGCGKDRPPGCSFRPTLKGGGLVVGSAAYQRERKRQTREHEEAMATVDDPSCSCGNRLREKQRKRGLKHWQRSGSGKRLREYRGVANSRGDGGGAVVMEEEAKRHVLLDSIAESVRRIKEGEESVDCYVPTQADLEEFEHNPYLAMLQYAARSGFYEHE